MTFIETFSAVFMAVTLAEIAKKVFNRYLDKEIDKWFDHGEAQIKNSFIKKQEKDKKNILSSSEVAQDTDYDGSSNDERDSRKPTT